MAEVLRTEGLCVRFGDTTALDDVTLRLAGPQLIGILGPNGAGKTTLLDVFLGLRKPTRGAVSIFGASPDPYPKSRVGVVMQREFVMDRVTVREYAELFAAIYRAPGGAERVVRGAELERRRDVAIDRLSAGELQRLFLAAAVVHSPDLVFLDEPTAHLDPEGKQRFGMRLRKMARERTLVLTTHDLREADALCDYLVFLVDGRVRACGTKDELLSAVPAENRQGLPVEAAFFHFCSVRIIDGGKRG